MTFKRDENNARRTRGAETGMGSYIRELREKHEAATGSVRPVMKHGEGPYSAMHREIEEARRSQGDQAHDR